MDESRSFDDYLGKRRGLFSRRIEFMITIKQDRHGLSAGFNQRVMQIVKDGGVSKNLHHQAVGGPHITENAKCLRGDARDATFARGPGIQIASPRPRDAQELAPLAVSGPGERQ